MKQKLLIFGVSGLLGNIAAKNLQKKYNIIGTYYLNKPKFNKSIKLIRCNFLNKNFIKKKIFTNFQPDIILNCAGEANVDFCETNKIYAKKLILNPTKIISDFSNKNNIYFIHISTDSLFFNNKKKNFEKEKTITLNYYSKLKLESEKYLIKNNRNFLIIRTRFFGKNISKKKCFAEEVIDKLKNNKTIECYKNVFNTNISCENLIDIIDECIEKKITGIFNIVGDKSYSKYNFARKIASSMNLNKKLIKKKIFTNKNRLIKKPFNTSLSNKKIKMKIKTPILDLERSINQTFK